MAAPTTELNGSGTITATGEANGLLRRLPLSGPRATVACIGTSGTNFATVVLAVAGRIGGQAVYYPLFGWTPAGTPIADSLAVALTNNAAQRHFFDVSGLDAYEVYVVSGTLTAALTVEESYSGGPAAAPINNVTLSNQLAVASAGSLNDAGGNELLKFPATVASAVNELTVTNAAAGAAPAVIATGGDTNISHTLGAKGTGVVQATAPTTDKRTQTATADTATITVAQLLTKVLDATPTAAATFTLPTAALLVAGIANCKVGDSFEFVINNKSAGANTVTVAAGADGTADGTLTVAQHVVRKFVVIVTSITGSSEAYFVYGVG